VAARLVRERGLRLVHSTNEPLVIAGAATLTLEILEKEPGLDALVLGVGGGSQAVGALTVIRAVRPGVQVFGVQAERASAIHDSRHAGRPISRPSADPFADGLATRNVYDFTFGPLREGLAGFVTGLAGLLKLRQRLAGRTVGLVLSGSSVDGPTLRRVLGREL
jgi:threonine dehydratase